jgi:hypothetical protein
MELPIRPARERILQDAQIVVEAGRRRAAEAVPFLERQHEVPEERDDAEEQDEQDRGYQIRDARSPGTLFHFHFAYLPWVDMRKGNAACPCEATFPGR